MEALSSAQIRAALSDVIADLTSAGIPDAPCAMRALGAVPAAGA